MTKEEEMEAERDPYAEGKEARLGGQSETANPYDPDEDEAAFMFWNDGWASIDQEDEG